LLKIKTAGNGNQEFFILVRLQKKLADPPPSVISLALFSPSNSHYSRWLFLLFPYRSRPDLIGVKLQPKYQISIPVTTARNFTTISKTIIKIMIRAMFLLLLIVSDRLNGHRSLLILIMAAMVVLLLLLL
jgi:hypothetical protein